MNENLLMRALDMLEERELHWQHRALDGGDNATWARATAYGYARAVLMAVIDGDAEALEQLR